MEFRLGDKVLHNRFGLGVVVNVNIDCIYPMAVKFGDNPIPYSFTLGGVYLIGRESELRLIERPLTFDERVVNFKLDLLILGVKVLNSPFRLYNWVKFKLM
jgi:hypothetical protein